MRLRLIQRFGLPLKDHKAAGTWKHAFGGGLPSGGMPDVVVKELAQICQPEYMGAAEYEFGELYRSYLRLRTMARSHSQGCMLTTGYLKIEGGKIKKLFVIAPDNLREPAVAAITRLASKPYYDLILEEAAHNRRKNVPACRDYPRDNPYFYPRITEGAKCKLFPDLPARRLPDMWWDIEHDVIWSTNLDMLTDVMFHLKTTNTDSDTETKDERCESTEAEKSPRRRSRKT